MWKFVIFVCLSAPAHQGECTGVQSLTIDQTKLECMTDAHYYASHTLGRYFVSLIDCYQDRSA